MISIDIVSKIVAREGEAKASPSKGIQSINLSDYLLKSVWDKVFEIRTDRQGKEYIFGKLPVVTQYGITMYADDGTLSLPSIYDGLPIDGTTIYWDTDAAGNRVLKAVGGGGTADSVAWANITGKPTWIGSSKPAYSYSEIQGTPDLSVYALKTQIPSLSGYATESWVNTRINSLINGAPAAYDTLKEIADVLQGNVNSIGDIITALGTKWTQDNTKIANWDAAYSWGNHANVGYALKTYVDSELTKYVTLSGEQTITGEKNFTGGLKVNGSPIVYDSTKKYWKLEGDLLVTGGVTMYGNEGTYTPSTIMDAILYDDETLGINSNGELYVKGGTGGGLDVTALQNYLTSNSYLNVTGGDNRYLKLSGGQINSGNDPVSLSLNNIADTIRIAFSKNNNRLGYLGFREINTPVYISSTGEKHELLHGENYSSYALPLSGGTMTGNILLGGTTTNKIGTNIVDTTSWQEFTHQNSHGYISLGPFNSSVAHIYTDRPSFYFNKELYVNNAKVWNAGNDGSGSTLDADLLDGQHGSWYQSNVIAFRRYGYTGTNQSDANVGTSGMLYNYGSNLYWKNAPEMSYGQILTLRSGDNLYLAGQLAWDVYHASTTDTTRYLWWRATDAGDWIEAKWHQIAFTDSNVASATRSRYIETQAVDGSWYNERYRMYAVWINSTTLKLKTEGDYPVLTDMTNKLQTARTLWGQSFDGTGNVDGKITLTTWDSDGTALRLGNGAANNAYISFYSYYGNAYTIGQNLDGFIISHNTYGNIFKIIGGKIGVGITNPKSKLHVADDFISYGVYGENRGSAPVNYWWGLYQCDGKIQMTRRSTSNIYESEYFYIDVASKNIVFSGGITMYSDQRKKTILNHVELSLKQIAEAPLIEHYYNGDDKKTTHVGSIAQYWAGFNDWFCKLDSEGFYTMEIQNAALASAISIARELDRYETKTDKDIKKLKKRICELEEEIERLRAS